MSKLSKGETRRRAAIRAKKYGYGSRENTTKQADEKRDD